MLLPFNVHAPGDVDGDKDKYIENRFCISSLDNIKNRSQSLFFSILAITLYYLPLLLVLS